MITPIRVTLAQLNFTVGDIIGNRKKIISGIEQAKKENADLVVFPELALTGYPPEDLIFKKHFLLEVKRELKSIAASSRGITAVVGYPLLEKGKTYNAVALISDGKILNSYCKHQLPNYGVFDEVRYFSPGKKPFHFRIKGIRFSLTICEDVWVQGSPVEKRIQKDKPDIVINISASPFYAGKRSLREKIMARFCRRTRTFLLYNNLIGGQDELVFDGGSMVMDPKGKVIKRAKCFAEDALTMNFSLGEGKKIILNKNGIHPISSCSLKSEEEVYQALVLGTRDYIQKNRVKKVVIGLSGGIDSSLVSAIAVDALGRENVIGVTMPSQYSSAETRSDAEVLAKNLNIRFLEIPIRDIFDRTVQTMSLALSEGVPGVELENLQARIRGNILMTLSNKYGWLVLSTGNKSEMAVGYSTLYGDMCGGYAVIKDVPKALVFRLAQYVNKKAGCELIPQSVISRPPTAELRPNQKDEDSLPPYATLDPILQAYVEEDKDPQKIISQGFDRNTVLRVIQMVDKAEFKRRQSPPGVKITPKAFGKDRRMPITCRYSPFGPS